MKIPDITEPQGKINMDVKIIYDKMDVRERWGKKMKTVVVVDADVEEGGKTALLDLYDDDIEKFKFGDKIRVINCYAKLLNTKRGEQALITYGTKGDELIGRYEKIEE